MRRRLSLLNRHTPVLSRVNLRQTARRQPIFRHSSITRGTVSRFENLPVSCAPRAADDALLFAVTAMLSDANGYTGYPRNFGADRTVARSPPGMKMRRNLLPVKETGEALTPHAISGQSNTSTARAHAHGAGALHRYG